MNQPAYNFPYLLGVATGSPIKIGFASKQQADRYRYSFYNWRRAARRRGENTYNDVSIYQREGLIIFATRHNAAKVPELAGAFPTPEFIQMPTSEEEDFLASLSSSQPGDLSAVDNVQPDTGSALDRPPPSDLPDFGD